MAGLPAEIRTQYFTNEGLERCRYVSPFYEMVNIYEIQSKKGKEERMRLCSVIRIVG
jgi:DUF1365 family protein